MLTRPWLCAFPCSIPHMLPGVTFKINYLSQVFVLHRQKVTRDKMALTCLTLVW